MLKQENLAANFCGLLALKGIKYLAAEWKVIGQEKDGSIISTWISKVSDDSQPVSHIGIYNPKEKSFEILYKFDRHVQHLVQASCNNYRTLLAFVIKEDDNGKVLYHPYLTVINNAENGDPIELLKNDPRRNRQIMVQFLWRQPNVFEKNYQDKFLVLIHHESILAFTTHLKKTEDPEDNGEIRSSRIDFTRNDSWYFDINALKQEVIAKNFTWAQFDSTNQALYYIHLKETTKISLENAEDEKIMISTLSAFQFHEDMPTETVLNIPLNLPKIPSNQNSDIYEDDTIPLRIHDSSLNLIIVSDESGMLFVCHYYLYQPIKQDEDKAVVNDVHFAYSVTVLHHGCVIHCIIPDIPWEKAKLMKPTFVLHGECHLLVFQAGLFMHLLDVGLQHEPCCHIVCPPFLESKHITQLVPCFKQNFISFDSATLDLISINIPKPHLIETFKNDESIDNRMSIIHYFLAHYNDIDIFEELLNIIMSQPMSLNAVPLLKEALIAGSYSFLKGLTGDALSLVKLLPLTTCITSKPISAKVSNLSVGLSHETLHNTAMMLLSPQQRILPYRVDMWTRLYDLLNEKKDGKQRFKSDQVTEKLIYSLTCYQPEALSRCTTPSSPSGSSSSSFSDLTAITTQRRHQNEMLPFIEFETCTASKQEHVISVNLRELSMHLVKNSVKQITGFRWLKDSFFDPIPAPSFVHAVSTKYVSAQLEMSRLLCNFVCRAAGVDARVMVERGFALVDQFSKSQRYLLFMLLERYCLAVESLSFPLPQGFASFFTYLGYRALNFDEFLQYAQRHVFELQIDVMKRILADIEDTDEGTTQKLSLLSLLPRSRARRLLNNWNHPISLMIRGREHATNILCGNPVTRRRNSSLSTSANLSSSNMSRNKIENAENATKIENLRALDSFLDLLTAKTNINELDYNLLIETTMASFKEIELN